MNDEMSEQEVPSTSNGVKERTGFSFCEDEDDEDEDNDNDNDNETEHKSNTPNPMVNPLRKWLKYRVIVQIMRTKFALKIAAIQNNDFDGDQNEFASLQNNTM